MFAIVTYRVNNFVVNTGIYINNYKPRLHSFLLKTNLANKIRDMIQNFSLEDHWSKHAEAVCTSLMRKSLVIVAIIYYRLDLLSCSKSVTVPSPQSTLNKKTQNQKNH